MNYNLLLLNNNVSETSELYTNALISYDNGDYQSAISLFKKVVENEPNYHDAWYTMGLAYFRLNDASNAIKSYRQAIKLKSDYYNTWYNLGLVYSSLKEYKNSLECYKKAKELDENHQIWLNIGYAEELSGNTIGALQSYEKALELNPNYSTGLYNKGLLLFSINSFKEASISFKKITEIDPNNDNAWYYLGRSLFQLKQYEDAIKSFETAVQIDPRKYDSYEAIGLSFESLGKLHQATYYQNLARRVKDLKFEFKITGSSANLITDLWTPIDELGYNIYIKTIIRLLLNLEKTPIAISIQAPWGAGKTSLMRMIQEKIDIKRYNKIRNKKYGIMTFSKIKEIKKELKNLIKKLDPINDSIHEEELVGIQIEDYQQQQKKGYVTVWFNPWEYENLDQIWAGLADSIIQEIVSRLPSGKKEIFLLQLNLRIFSFKDLLRWIQLYILRQVWKIIRPWIFVTIGGLAASTLTVIVSHPSFSTLGLPEIFSTLGLSGFGASIIHFIIRFFKDKDNIENLSANFAFNEYLKIPDYSAKLGKVREAMDDIRRILKAIPEDYLPLVIFIDDLDRCSPNNIANVFEAINLFISTNFQNCIFLIGMDNQVVVSALEVIYEKIIKKLPEYSIQSQLGWRFIEKFIQLPILIPPTEEKLFKIYIESLVLNKEEYPIDDLYKTNIKNDKFFEDNVNNLDESLEQREVDNIDSLSQAAYIFSNNPRDVKRFLNLITYYFNLHSEIKKLKPDIELPDYEQMRRWIILILKWPSLAQWLYWTQDTLSYSISPDVLNSTKDKLKLLEKFAFSSKNQQDWEINLKHELNITDSTRFLWIVDNNAREFFRDENNQPEGKRISDGAGLGIY